MNQTYAWMMGWSCGWWSIHHSLHVAVSFSIRPGGSVGGGGPGWHGEAVCVPKMSLLWIMCKEACVHITPNSASDTWNCRQDNMSCKSIKDDKRREQLLPFSYLRPQVLNEIAVLFGTSSGSAQFFTADSFFLLLWFQISWLLYCCKPKCPSWFYSIND